MADSPHSAARLTKARGLLAQPYVSEGLAALAASAAFFAITAMALAVTVVMLPTPWPRT